MLSFINNDKLQITTLAHAAGPYVTRFQENDKNIFGYEFIK